METTGRISTETLNSFSVLNDLSRCPLTRWWLRTGTFPRQSDNTHKPLNPGFGVSGFFTRVRHRGQGVKVAVSGAMGFNTQQLKVGFGTGLSCTSPIASTARSQEILLKTG